MSAEEDKDEKEYEDRLRRRLLILKEQLEAGKVSFAPGLKVVDSLKAVRTAPDGSIDLSTVDSLVRSLAVVVEHLHDRQELKESIPLADIQSAYFAFLENNFGHFFKIMKERRLTPHDAGMALSRSPDARAEILLRLDDFLCALDEFWDSLADVAHIHVEDLQDSVKGVFGGDLFPAHDENLASKCGIYLDTLVLPDPFIRSRELFSRWGEEEQAFYLIKHGMNLLQYKELACADVSPPIVVVLPDLPSLEPMERDFTFKLGQKDALLHAARIFGRDFESFESLLEFAEELDSIERLIPEVAAPDRILFDTEWSGDLASQLLRATKDQHSELIGTNHPGIIVASQAVGRMSVSNELLIKSRRLMGFPVIDAPTSWQYLVWKLEYDAERAKEVFEQPHLHVARGLQNLANNEMEWLGRVPPSALIEVRKSGAIDEIREILGRGVADLATANPSNFHRTSDLVFDNLNEAFEEHRKRLAELREKKWKFAGSDVGSWLVVGSLAVTAAATGVPVWGLAAIAADQLLDAPKLRDIPTSVRELASQTNELKRSPVGLLFSCATTKA